MIGFSLPLFFVYLAGLVLYASVSMWQLLASGHPVFFVMLSVGLFFFYLIWVVLVDDWQPPRPDRQL